MKFESPPNEGTTVRKQDTPEEIAQKKIRRQGAAVAAVGLLALSDVQAMEVPEAPLSEPTAVIQYEPSPPSANVRVPVDKNGRASLPAKSFQNPEEVLVTSDDVIGSVPSAEEKPGRTVLFSDYQTRKVPSANPEVVNEQYHTRIDQLKKVTPPDFRTAGEQEIDASMMRIDRAFRIPESISWTHEQVSGLLARVAEVTGADPTGRIQQAADILLSGAAELADSVLSGKLKALALKSWMDENTRRANAIGGAASVQGAAENAALAFDMSHLNARNMLLQYKLGGNKSDGWELTFGAGLGNDITEIAKGKIAPAVGVVFRLKLP